MTIEKPGYDVLAIKSLYGSRQAGKIWGHEIHNKLIRMNVSQIQVDSRLYYFKYNRKLIIFCIVVDDIAFASFNQKMMVKFKESFSETFDVRFYREVE